MRFFFFIEGNCNIKIQLNVDVSETHIQGELRTQKMLTQKSHWIETRSSGVETCTSPSQIPVFSGHEVRGSSCWNLSTQGLGLKVGGISMFGPEGQNRKESPSLGPEARCSSCWNLSSQGLRLNAGGISSLGGLRSPQGGWTLPPQDLRLEVGEA